MHLRHFGDFVAELGTQTVTVTQASLEEDMLEEYATIVAGLQPFSCHPHEAEFNREFLRTRECFFFYGDDRPPVVEATFTTNFHDGELSVDVQYSWAPPLLYFDNLRNVIVEGEQYMLKPLTVRLISQDNFIVRTSAHAIVRKLADPACLLRQTSSSAQSKKHGSAGTTSFNASMATYHSAAQHIPALADWTPTLYRWNSRQLPRSTFPAKSDSRESSDAPFHLLSGGSRTAVLRCKSVLGRRLKGWRLSDRTHLNSNLRLHQIGVLC